MLRVGDVVEVVKDFDSGVVSPGDRALHEGRKRWWFLTRMPSFGVLPVYEVRPLDVQKGWLKVVDYLDAIPDSVVDHPVLRLARREHFVDSCFRHLPSVRKVWQLDLRHSQSKEELDTLVAAIVRDEPDLLCSDISYHFFQNALVERGRWPSWSPIDGVTRAVKASLGRLTTAGRVYQPKGSLRYQVTT